MENIEVFGNEMRIVEGFENYAVSKKGLVWCLSSGYPVDHIRNRYVVLRKGSKTYTKRVADLVANAWLPNPRGWAYVKHKNGDVDNNSISNLAFSPTRVYERRSKDSSTSPVLQYTLDGALVGKYNSVSMASTVSGVDKGSISRCCHGSYMSAGGYVWGFEDVQWYRRGRRWKVKKNKL